jgi:hypothetical protein
MKIVSVVYCPLHKKGYVIAENLPEYSTPPAACRKAVCQNADKCDAYVDSHLLLSEDCVTELTPLIDRSGGDWSKSFYQRQILIDGSPYNNSVLTHFLNNYDYSLNWWKYGTLNSC